MAYLPRTTNQLPQSMTYSIPTVVSSYMNHPIPSQTHATFPSQNSYGTNYNSLDPTFLGRNYSTTPVNANHAYTRHANSQPNLNQFIHSNNINANIPPRMPNLSFDQSQLDQAWLQLSNELQYKNRTLGSMTPSSLPHEIYHRNSQSAPPLQEDLMTGLKKTRTTIDYVVRNAMCACSRYTLKLSLILF